jgi:phosphatidylglycerol lysyltransferase
LLPLGIAAVGLAFDEVRQRADGAPEPSEWFRLAPRALSALTFVAGVILLFSGATPAAPGRLGLLHRLVPLGLIELSHFIGSVVGALLLVLAHGLARRLDAAYFFALAGIAVGIAASLAKGADIEEAVLLTFLLLILLRTRPAFDRHAAFFETRFSTGWLLAVAGALGASIWLGFFAFQHVEYSHDLWWQFELHGEASRFLRATVGASTALLTIALARLIRPAPHQVEKPDSAALEAAGVVISRSCSTSANLVFLRDKAILFDEERAGFVMYGVQGRTWVALEDPVGGRERAPHLIRLFLERCDDFAGVPVFYQVRKESLHHYADFGLTFVKLGEEASVDLTRFTLQGGKASKYRQVLRRLEKDGGEFRLVPAGDVSTVLGELRRVSDDWLKEKSAAEKGFSLGFFDDEYLRRFPAACVVRSGRIQAFANVWLDPCAGSMSVDLMRYHHEAPRDVMEALFVHLMKWGHEQGYRTFSLGMAPLAGFESSPVATLWYRLGSFLYKHGESFYNFQGLRAYKNKFDPVWEPRYLAYPGRLRLPRILADVAALIAGGYRNILRSEPIPTRRDRGSLRHSGAVEETTQAGMA